MVIRATPGERWGSKGPREFESPLLRQLGNGSPAMRARQPILRLRSEQVLGAKLTHSALLRVNFLFLSRRNVGTPKADFFLFFV